MEKLARNFEECTLVTGKRSDRTRLETNFKDKILHLKSRLPRVSSTKCNQPRVIEFGKMCPSDVCRYIRRQGLYARGA